jgi:hypothetical protein
MPKLTFTGDSDDEDDHALFPSRGQWHQAQHQRPSNTPYQRQQQPSSMIAPNLREIDETTTAKSIEHNLAQTIDHLATSFAIEPGVRLQDEPQEQKPLPDTVIEVSALA